MLFINTAALLLSAVAASPIAEPVAEPVTVNLASAFCAVVTGLVTKAKAQPQATSYCSSYLSLKPAVTTKNVKVTSYTATVVVTIPTSTFTQTNYVTEQSIAFVGVLPTGTCSILPAKRGISTIPKPACLATYTAPAIVSSACKCLSIPVSTSTATIAATVPGISTSTQNVITEVITKTTTQVQTSTTTNSYFNIRASGAVDALAAQPTAYVYDRGVVGVPFDGSRTPSTPDKTASKWKLSSDCELRYAENSDYLFEDMPAWVRDGSFLQFYEGYCNIPNTNCSPLKCYVSADRKMQCIGPEGQSVSSVCPWPRVDSDVIWYVGNGLSCGAESQIFLSIE
ncbi:hypothetical protein Q7P37_008294 [Cladosporium fusiforme]